MKREIFLQNAKNHMKVMKREIFLQNAKTGTPFLHEGLRCSLKLHDLHFPFLQVQGNQMDPKLIADLLLKNKES